MDLQLNFAAILLSVLTPASADLCVYKCQVYKCINATLL